MTGINPELTSTDYFYTECPLFSFAGLISTHEYRPDRFNLKEILLRIAPFFAQNFTNNTEDQIVSYVLSNFFARFKRCIWP